MSQCEPIDRFRAAIAADEPLQLALSAIADPEAFAARAIEAASALGIALERAHLAAAFKPDPLGILRLDHPARDGWPPRHWLPVEIVRTDEGEAVDWVHFAGEPLTDPYYAKSVRRVVDRPFNRLFRWRTPLDRFVAEAPAQDRLKPRGFVFHQSRCGSTLVSQMLGALPGAVSVSEAPVIDSAVKSGRAELLAAVIAAVGRPRPGASRLFVKLDSWHAIALPLFRKVFPETPWIFLYRDPVEIMVSQLRMRGHQTVPQFLSPEVYGLEGECDGEEEYCARLLARVGQAAIDHFALGGGLMVEYESLPEAVCGTILPHFGWWCGDSERGAMAPAALRNAKNPGEMFARDGEGKRAEASSLVQEAVKRHLAPVHAGLEALR